MRRRVTRLAMAVLFRRRMWPTGGGCGVPRRGTISVVALSPTIRSLFFRKALIMAGFSERLSPSAIMRKLLAMRTAINALTMRVLLGVWRRVPIWNSATPAPKLKGVDMSSLDAEMLLPLLLYRG